MTPKEKISGLIGLARRGRYIAYGDDLAFRIRKKQVSLLFLADDASERTGKELEISISKAPNLKVLRGFTKEELGLAIGHDPIAALGIKNSGIAGRIRQLEEEIENNGQEK